MKLLILALLAAPVLAQAAPRPVPDVKMCARAVTEDRLGYNNVADCLCMARTFRSTFHPQVFALWSQAMYLGEDRLREALELGFSREQLSSQLQAGARAAKKACDFDFG